jgi:dihydrofolate synthase/folylpolyglutamate synthase
MPVDVWTPAHARAWLDDLQRRGMLLGLDRVEDLAGRLGNPERSFPSILIAGTNGKGTVAALLDAVLVSAGLAAGRYTSPHLVDWPERITISGRPISWPDLAVALQAVSLQAERVKATPFEAITMAAFWHFRASGVERGVIEVGLGGRLDATRICNADVTVITAIGLDHTAELGDDLTVVAREKGAISRAGVPVVLGPGTDPVRSVLVEQASAVQAPVVSAGSWAQVDGSADGGWGLDGTAIWLGEAEQIADSAGWSHSFDWHVPLAGHHTLNNITTTLAVLACLRRLNVDITTEDIQTGFGSVHWPGRLQHIPAPGDGPGLLLDVAHNPLAAGHVAREVAERSGDSPIHIVVALAEDKDIEGVLEHIVPLAEAIIATTWSGPRAASAQRVADAARRISSRLGVSPDVSTAPDPTSAVAAATSDLNGDGIVLVIGSHMLVGALLTLLEEPDGPARLWQD